MPRRLVDETKWFKSYMRKIKPISISLALIGVALAIYLAFSSEYAVTLHPKGLMARRILSLIRMNLLLIFSIMIPTWLWLFWTAWHQRSSNTRAEFQPEHSVGWIGQSLQWIIPSILIAIMVAVNWPAIHELDPYRPLQSEVKPLRIQVVALNWKWLFIYPEQEIATLNFLQFPVHTPINFSLSADGAPMNSFWIPQLSGQIYSMTGMVTPLHIMADEIGEYAGKAAEINGEGYASMNFIAKATSNSDFEAWVKSVKQSPFKLTNEIYAELIKPSIDILPKAYSQVEEKMFESIVMKPMHPH